MTDASSNKMKLTKRMTSGQKFILKHKEKNLAIVSKNGVFLYEGKYLKIDRELSFRLCFFFVIYYTKFIIK